MVGGGGLSVEQRSLPSVGRGKERKGKAAAAERSDHSAFPIVCFNAILFIALRRGSSAGQLPTPAINTVPCALIAFGAVIAFEIAAALLSVRYCQTSNEEHFVCYGACASAPSVPWEEQECR